MIPTRPSRYTLIRKTVRMLEQAVLTAEARDTKSNRQIALAHAEAVKQAIKSLE